eukprot:5445252-Alexandrium_andersonii.AAC.1
MPSIYRIYARMRLRQMRNWTQQWAPRTLFSGVCGRGAEDAWYEVALMAEDARQADRGVAITAFDLYKAFDRVARPTMFG